MSTTQKAFLPNLRRGSDPLWYKNAVIYQVHVRSFADSNADGIGDFAGLTARLDYVQDLGVTALWLLPFYPSPLRDDGYDIADYTDVNSMYGTLDDFDAFLAEAHRRKLRVITELVLNHTSDQHPWFQRARRAPIGSPERDFYVWSDDPKKYSEVRIIFQDFESSNWSWDPLAKQYYWHRFYSHQPDLNFDNSEVHCATFAALDFWFKRGVDGLRLDAIPYLYEREGTNGENLPETHDYLRKLRGHVDANFKDRMLLAEANQWPEDAAAYFGQGDECHMAFHFPLMPRLFMALRMEERFPIIDILQQTPAIPSSCQWALFLRNHDELTLEMVTDEERDYMYRLYAQEPQMRINLGIRRRLAPLLENHRAKIELLTGLLLSLPGTPVLYYGDEIGMGDNIYLGDRNGVRTPMQWSGERNAGFSKANPQRLFLPVIIDPEYHFQAVNVETQQENPHSLLWWTKRLIAMRKRHRAFGQGTLEFIPSDNPKVLAFVRRLHDEQILVAANLSRLPQYAELDVTGLEGLTPIEMMGRTPFPTLVAHPFSLTLGAYGFFWFNLEVPAKARVAPTAGDLPLLAAAESWDQVLRPDGRGALEEILASYLEHRPWFQGKGRQIDHVRIHDAIPIRVGEATAYLALVESRYSDGDSDCYILPLGFATGQEADAVVQTRLHRVIARLTIAKDGESANETSPVEGILYDCAGERQFSWAIMEAVVQKQRLRGAAGALVGTPLTMMEQTFDPSWSSAEPNLVHWGEGSMSLIYGEKLFLKTFRWSEAGINPEFEVGRFLSEKTSFGHTPPVAGILEYRHGRDEPLAVAVVEDLIANQGTGWNHALDALGRYCELARTRGDFPDDNGAHDPLVKLASAPPPELAQEMFGGYLETVRLLGQRTAEFHTALASGTEPAFAPEPFTLLYQRSLYQSLRGQVRRTFRLLRRNLSGLPPETRSTAETLLAREDDIIRRGERVFERRIAALRTRCHGDYDLSKVLHTGNDFAIVGLEGDISRPLSDRRRKRTPLRDAASMLLSFRLASAAALERLALQPEELARLRPWTTFWQDWVSAAFLGGYRASIETSGIVPSADTELEALLGLHVLKRAAHLIQLACLHHSEHAAAPLLMLAELLEPNSRSHQPLPA